MDAPTQTNLVNLTIDGVAVSVPKGTTVYTAAQQLGLEIPIFCYQDRMPPFGACRVCLVEVEKMPKLQTSCTLEAMEGMVVHTQSEKAVKGREGIVELLLINHPLDCPICDRGGECPLQENALRHGPGQSRFFEDKRRFKKPLPLGPVLMLDRERCIICARCTRFGDIVAGDHALEFIERGYKTEVGTPDGGPADSKFIGNTIMICPVGALTSQVYRFRARPWDNDSTESTCSLCPVGCSMILDSRDGEIMRTRSRENPEVNDIWLCDKGWFGYEFAYHPNRLKTPLIRQGDKLLPATWDDAISLIVTKMQEAKKSGKIGALGGNPLTLEENYLFQQLMREGAGVNNVDHRVGMPLYKDEGIAGMEISIGECEKLSFAILLGVDLTEEFPVIWLRLKQAINKGATIVFIGHYAPEISLHLSQTFLHAPGDELKALQEHLPYINSLAEKGAKGALFVGRQYLANSQRSQIISELLKLKNSSHVSLNILEASGNSMGARYAGMHPHMGPFGKPVSNSGLNAKEMLETAAESGWDLLYVAGADPAMKYPSALWKAARSRLGFLVVQDLFLNETARQADVVLPTLSFIEKGGSFMNIEGRIQRLLPGKEIPTGLYSDAQIFTLLAEQLGITVEIPTFKDVRSNINNLTTESTQSTESEEQLRNGLKASFAPILFDRGVRMKHNPHVSQLAKEPFVRIHPKEGQKREIQSGKKIRISTKDHTIEAKVKWDEGVAEGTIVLPVGFEQVPVHELTSDWLNGLEVEIG